VKPSKPNLRGSIPPPVPVPEVPPPSVVPVDVTVEVVKPSILQSVWSFLSKYRTRDLIVTGFGISSFLASTIYSIMEYRSLSNYLLSFNTRSAFEIIFQKLYSKQIQSADQFHLSVGNTVIDNMINQINATVLPTMTTVKKDDITALERIITGDIANLRRRASPNYPVLIPIELSSVKTAISPAMEDDSYGAEVGKSSFLKDPLQRFDSIDNLDENEEDDNNPPITTSDSKVERGDDMV
jgi:hypothetical protein